MNSSEGNYTKPCDGSLDLASSVILATLNIISGIFSVGGNTLVILAIARTPHLQRVSNYFVASLAVADFSVGLIINPLWAAKSALNIWKNQDPLTQAAEFMSMQTLCATTLSLCAVSVDRYLAITRVFFYEQYVDLRRCLVTIASIWFFSFAIPLPRLFITDPLDLPNLWIASSVTAFIIPFNIIAFCYWRIYQAAHAQAQKIENNSSANNSQATRKKIREKKAACTIAIIIGLFLLFSSPAMILSSVQVFTTDKCSTLNLIRYWFWTVLVAFACSACNPWVYAIRSREYRSAFRRLVGIRTSVHDQTANASTFNNTQD